MSIQYPIVLPAQGFRSIRMSANDIVTVAASPFTGQQQVQAQQGQFWRADVAYPPMKQSGYADDVTAALVSLRGQYGTFLLGDSSRKTPRGSGAGTSLPYVYGSSQTGHSLITRNWPVSADRILVPGDYFQVGGRNQLKHSQAFSNADWVRVNILQVTDNSGATTSPIGDSTASEIQANSAAAANFGQMLTADSDEITFSIFAKKGSGANDANEFSVYNSNTGLHLFYISVNYDTATITSSGGYEVASSIGAVYGISGGWVKITISVSRGFIIGDTLTAFAGFIGSPVSAGEYFYAWGAHVNPGLDADPYQLTTSAAVSTPARLHKVVLSARSGASTGDSTLEIWPRLRESPTAGSHIKTVNPRGTFRLASNERSWDVDEAKTYGVSFSAVEAI